MLMSDAGGRCLEHSTPGPVNLMNPKIARATRSNDLSQCLKHRATSVIKLGWTGTLQPSRICMQICGYPCWGHS